jgi:hypothetical protein
MVQATLQKTDYQWDAHMGYSNTASAWDTATPPTMIHILACLKKGCRDLRAGVLINSFQHDCIELAWIYM